MESSSPLHICSTCKISSPIFNRSYAFFHFTALIFFIYYRLSYFLFPNPTLLHTLLFTSELLLSFIWLCGQAFLWRPVSRTVYPERLPENKELPSIDVLICTADPKKEPPFEVMNTVLSALAMDYPPDKLAVYLSDDGGSSLTLKCMREAYGFARYWLPFCLRFRIKNRCPKVYFAASEDDLLNSYNVEYAEEKEKIKRKYEQFKDRVKQAEENDYEKEEGSNIDNDDHPPVIQVINEESNNELDINQVQVPLLVYVSREKRPNHTHHFKAGALNVLLRVSGIMTNSPYMLVLDCDMYCNDPTSARQAMCFHLDPQISPSLAFVQFPQKFHNISKSDIYDSQLRTLFVIRWPGVDGLQGPILSGTGFYMKRNALYGNISEKGVEQLKRIFGHSNDFIMSVHNSSQQKILDNTGSSSKLLQEAQFLAKCTYEQDTLWGQQIGFLYESVVEDFFTGMILHCRGWNSVLCNPSRAAFAGTATTNLNDTLIQNTRWQSGLMEVTISRFCPFIYGISRMSLLQTMCYGCLALQPLYSFPLWCLATLPQLCLFNDIPIYPKVSSSWFMIFSFIFVASLLKHLEEVLSSGGTVKTWWNEQHIWMIKAVTAYTYGSLDAILKWVGIRKASFIPTNKVPDEGKISLYQKGKFNFQTSTRLLAPITTLVVLNMISLIIGVARMLISGNWSSMFGQVFLSFYIVVVNFPVIEGMLLRKDEGCIPFLISLLSLALALTFLYIGSMVL
ncbi:cellulose synthase-like protein G3 [Mercurialis annua]|uniref:cellulose synthase-like protein G3 n=1 Tax=Mercurialis annua TaxID=3986 RepID=UPI00215E698B|nr:cellulose synthase-like protein G3 [Mercurialis annua]